MNAFFFLWITMLILYSEIWVIFQIDSQFSTKNFKNWAFDSGSLLVFGDRSPNNLFLMYHFSVLFRPGGCLCHYHDASRMLRCVWSCLAEAACSDLPGERLRGLHVYQAGAFWPRDAEVYVGRWTAVRGRRHDLRHVHGRHWRYFLHVFGTQKHLDKKIL